MPRKAALSSGSARKRRAKRKPRKRKYSSLVLVDANHEVNPTKKRKISQSIGQITHFENNYQNTNNTIDAEDTETEFFEEITQFDDHDDEFMSIFDTNKRCIIKDNVYLTTETKEDMIEEEEIIPGDHAIDYGLIEGATETASCQYHERLIRCEQKEQYNEYKKELETLDKKLNDKHNQNDLFDWKLMEYMNDDKQTITLNKIKNIKKKDNYPLQQEVLLFCNCCLNHNYHGINNSFQSLLKCNLVLFGKVIDIKKTSVSIRIKKYNSSLAEYDSDNATATDQPPFHSQSTCLFRIDLDKYLFFTFGLQLKAIETFYSSTTVQLGPNWCSKYFYECSGVPNGVSLITTREIVNAVESSSLIKHLSVPHELISLIANRFIGEHDEYTNIKRLNESFNDSQIKAIYNGCCNDVSLIQGPPGTGKTFTAVHIVEKLFLNHRVRKYRAILTAHTHAACDSLLLELHNHEFSNGMDLNITRFSNQSRIKMFDLQPYSYREKMKKHAMYQTMIALFKQARDKRLSREQRQDKLNEARSLEQQIIFDVLCGSDIIVLTCYACCKSVLAARNIDISAIIIDEATQIVEPEVLGVVNLLQNGRERIEEIKYWKRTFNMQNESETQLNVPNKYPNAFATYIRPILNFNKKLIMIGDPKQLPPVVRNKEAERMGYNITLFDRLLQRISISKIRIGLKPTTDDSKPALGNFVMLNKQYRGYELCGHEFCSMMFYGGRVQHDKFFNQNDKLIGGFVWENDKPFNFVAVNSKQSEKINGNYNNEVEAKCIIKIVKGIMDYGLYSNENREDTIKINDFRDIGIITPHREQSILIQKMLTEKYGYKTANLLATSTVDAFQGQQRSLIIYSMTRTDRACNKFTTNRKRINVALTRAKDGLIVIGNSIQFGGFRVWRELHEYLSEKGIIKKY